MVGMSSPCFRDQAGPETDRTYSGGSWGSSQMVTLSLRFSAPKKPRFNITNLSSIRLDAVREVSKAMGFRFRKRLRIFPGQNPKDHERDKDQVYDVSDRNNLTLPAQPPPRISSRGKLMNQN